MFKTKREARLSDFEHPMRSVCTTLLREVRWHLSSTNKKMLFFFVLRSVCTTLLREVRRRFGSKNKSFFNFHFVLRSPCTNFHCVQVRLHLSSPNKKNAFFLCTAFGLH